MVIGSAILKARGTLPMRMLQQFFAWLSLAFGYVKENATKILLIIFIIYIAGLAIEGVVILTSYILEKRKKVPGEKKCRQ